MKITIDTQNDSKEDLKRLVELINSIINNQKEENNNYEENNKDENLNKDGMFSMFDEDKEKNKEKDNSYNIVPY